MEQGRASETELMPRLVGGDTETIYSKLKTGNRFSKPNLESLPKLRQVRRVRRVGGLLWLYPIRLNSTVKH
jgi:hypothetical protein